MEAFNFFSRISLSKWASFHLNWIYILPQKAQEQSKGENNYNFSREWYLFWSKYFVRLIDYSIYFCLCMAISGGSWTYLVKSSSVLYTFDVNTESFVFFQRYN